MNVIIHESHIEIKLSLKEKIISNHISFNKIPIAHITSVSVGTPETSSNDYRDGLPVPNIKAGTLYTPRGFEFWYVNTKKQSNYLILDLKDEHFHRIVLTIDNNRELRERIDSLLRKQ